MINRIKHIVLPFSVLVALAGCNQKSNEKESIQIEENVEVNTTNEDLSKGFQLLETSCFSCHTPNLNIENKIAPTWAEIKTYYAPKGATRESFMNSFIEFVSNPTEENAIIPKAIALYGVMPNFNLSNEQISEIASYVYATELEMPEWYDKFYEGEKEKYKANREELPFAERGMNLVMTTKSVLGKNLKGAIKSQGPENAITFCNERAYPLVDSMALVLNAMIKRVSDKPRNPNNSANENELKYIEASKEILLSGGKIKPQLQENNGKMVGYYPILTNQMCLQCHGQPNTQILPKTMERLNKLYPEDQAKGYGDNQLRGIWVVEMEKK
ncbi:MAG: DUF3365 domain-containing protein [Cyclobacteriaceae bacterium]|nr:DUF3365 domain-containing protein [Cyclobacteriaceae bacterium]